MKNKKIIITLSIIAILVLTIGITYSIFTSSKTGKNSNLVVGDIYMHYNETNQIQMENAMPTTEYDLTKYFEFTIDGKNTYDKPIYYEIDLTNGDEEVGKTRIDSNLLTFRLTEFKDNVETEIFHNRAYSDLTNKRIHVDAINKSDGNVKRTYRLYVKVGDYTRIGNTEDADYTMEEWNNIYASIKIKVIGDFEEKTIETDPSKFVYSVVYNNEEYTKTISSDFTLNDITNDSEKLKKCVDYILIDVGGLKIGSDDYNNAYSTFEGLCKGETEGDLTLLTFFNTASAQGMNVDYQYLENEGIISNYKEGTIKYVNSNKEELDINSIDKSKISIKLIYTGTDKDVVIPKKIDGIDINCLNYIGNVKGKIYNVVLLNNVIKINALSNFGIRNIEIPDSVTTIGNDAFSNNQLTSVIIPDSVTTIGNGAFCNNKLANAILSNRLEYIGNNAFQNNQLTSITIPDSVTTIGNGAFYDNQLTSVILSNRLEYIDVNAFAYNQLTSVIIPDSVTTIGNDAFSNNQLANAILSNRLEYIGNNAFQNNQLTSITIPDSVTTIGNYVFYNNKLTSITIGKGILYIASQPFAKSTSSNPNLSKITINKSCNEIKNIQAYSTDTTKYYPWLSYSKPYTASGVTIYGSNNEVCDSY